MQQAEAVMVALSRVCKCGRTSGFTVGPAYPDGHQEDQIWLHKAREQGVVSVVCSSCGRSHREIDGRVVGYHYMRQKWCGYRDAIRLDYAIPFVRFWDDD